MGYFRLLMSAPLTAKMTTMDTPSHLSFTTRSLHWIIAVGFIALSALGIYMALTETWWLYHWHKSFAILLFAIILLRVVWRLKQGWPVPVQRYQRHEQQLAKLVHWVLLLGTLAMPITGMIYSGSSGNGFGIFNWTIMPANPDPANPDNTIPFNATLMAFGETAHEIMGYTLVVALLAHIAGALKHHLWDKDGTLLRMLGK